MKHTTLFKLAGIILTITIIVSASHMLANDPQGDIEFSIFSGWSFLDASFDQQHWGWPCWDDPIPLENQSQSMQPFFPYCSTHRSLDKSFLFGFKVGYYFNKNSEIEGTFSIAPTHHLSSDMTYDCPDGRLCALFDTNMPELFPYYQTKETVVAYHYDTNFVYNFTTTNIRPFVTIGIGGVTYDVQESKKTDFTANLGLGMKFYFDNIGLRFEVNEHYIPKHFLTGKGESDLQLMLGIFLRY